MRTGGIILGVLVLPHELVGLRLRNKEVNESSSLLVFDSVTGEVNDFSESLSLRIRDWREAFSLVNVYLAKSSQCGGCTS